jgi:two-component system sensor histidine kinase QseC
MLALGVLIVTAGAAVYVCARAGLQRQFDATLRAKAETLQMLTEQKSSGIEIDFSGEDMRGYEAGGGDFFELRAADGKMVAHSPALHEELLPIRGSSDAPTLYDVKLFGTQRARVINIRFYPRLDEENIKGVTATLIVASLRGELDRTLGVLQVVLAGCGVALLALTAWVVPNMLRRGLAPLQHVAERAGRIDAGSLSARFATENLPGELTAITTRLNELLGRLEESFERERRFSADVAHEFRTPIAELRSMAELALKLPEERLAGTDREVLAIAKHLESVTNQLLMLARGERTNGSCKTEEVDLPSLVEEVSRKFESKARTRGLGFQMRLAGKKIRSQPALLQSILMNLLDNAVEYTPCGGSVELEVRDQDGRFAIEVTNTVDGLDDADVNRLFERFWRKDPARTNNGHTGLGLPLARTFARALGCQLRARLEAGGKLRLTLEEEVMKFEF